MGDKRSMDKLCRKAVKGFTLIELMIVVVIIGILASIAIPKFADLMTRSKESAVKGALASLRSAVSIYYSDTDGLWPGNMSSATLFVSALTTDGKYLNAMPYATIPAPGSHAKSNRVRVAAGFIDYSSSAVWWWQRAPTGPLTGRVAVNCNHMDSAGTTVWSSF
jgi:prepilin-type N-terminal cleavage/methylation domain-containing protein